MPKRRSANRIAGAGGHDIPLRQPWMHGGTRKAATLGRMGPHLHGQSSCYGAWMEATLEGSLDS